MQCSAWRPTSSAALRAAVVEQDRWNSCGPSPGRTPVQNDVYGFIRSAVDERGSSWRKTSRSATGQHLLDPHHRHEHPRQRRAHAAVALGLHHGDRAGLGDAEVRAAHRQRARGTSRAGARAPPRSAPRASESSCPWRSSARTAPDLRPVAVDRRDEDVRRPVARELDDELGEVGLDRGSPLALQRVVELDLVGRQRLDLDHLVVPCSRAIRATIAFASARRAPSARCRRRA